MLVTKDDYFKSRGIDLLTEFSGDSDNPSMEVNLFLINQENWIKNWVKMNYQPLPEEVLKKYPEFENEVYKEAIMAQIDYYLLHGNRSIIELSLDQNFLSPNAFMILKNNGMANIKKNYKRIPYQWRRY